MVWVAVVAGLLATLAIGIALFTDVAFKDAVASIQGIGTVSAVCVGGAFAFYRLQMFRTFQPHLSISHDVSHRPIGNSYVHVALAVTLVNGSRVKIDLLEGYFQLLQVSPVSDEAIERLYTQTFIDRVDPDLQWPVLDDVERSWHQNELTVEPGESHRETCEFIVSSGVESVIAYSYFYNSKAAEHQGSSEGWSAETVHDIVE